MKRVILMSVLLLGFTGLQIKAQEKMNPNNRTVGITASIQQSQLGILVPIWVGPKVSISPGLDIAYAQTVGTDLGIGVVPKFYLKAEKLSPYFSMRAGAIFNIPSSDNEIQDETKVDILAGLGFGAEYFFDEHFSMGVEAQANFTFSDESSDRFGNPDGMNFNTAAAVTASIYF